MADATWKDKTYNEYYEYLKKGYNPSAEVQKSQNQMNSIKQPDQYNSAYNDSINSGINKYVNSKFDYDYNNDPAYHRKKQEYTQNAQKAMEDTVGQVSALTGGYGNSYAQTAGQETYNDYMSKVTDVIDSLENKAYTRYQDGNNQLLNGIGLMQTQDNTGYNRYRDTMSDYYTNRDYYTNQYNNEKSFDYNAYRDVLDAYYNNAQYQNTDYWNMTGQENTDRQFNYNAQQDSVANQLAQEQLAYQRQQDAITQQQWQAEMELQRQQAKEKNTSSQKKAEKSLDTQAPKTTTQSQLSTSNGYADTLNKIKKSSNKEDKVNAIIKFANVYQYAPDWNEGNILQLAQAVGLTQEEINFYFG